MKVLNIKKATPMFTRIITTADRFTIEEAKHNGIIDSTKEGQIKDIQTIVSVSEQAAARGLKVGDVILLDFNRYAQMRQKKDSLKSTTDEFYNNVKSYEIPIILLDSREHLFVDLADIQLIVNDHDYITEGEGILTGDNKEFKLGEKSGIILPGFVK